MSGEVRKGALAENRMSLRDDVAEACDDLARLSDFGALAGMAEILRERRRQVELGLTAEHDDTHADGRLAAMALDHLTLAFYARSAGASSADTDTGRLCRAAALIAAEIDRLNRLAATEAEAAR